MAHFDESHGEPFKGASAIAQWVPVVGLEGTSSADETVIRAGSTNQFPIGMTIATVASPGDPVTVITGGKTKGIAGASLGAFTPVGVGSTNGILIPLTRYSASYAASNTALAQISQVGIAMQSAAAGDVFTILVKPAQVL